MAVSYTHLDVYKRQVTGLTLGLAGSQVSDGYVCTINYLPPGAPTPISRKARHAIHTTIGASAAPANGVQAASAEEAIHTVTPVSYTHLDVYKRQSE